MLKKKVNRPIVILASLLLCVILFFGTVSASITKVFAAESSSNDTVLYLSDTTRIQHNSSKSTSLGGGNTRLFMAPSALSNIPGGVMQAKIEGSWYTFKDGIYAHAASYIAFDISEFSNKYKYFSAYAGILSGATKSDGALFYFQTSVDGNEWKTKEPSDTSVATDEIGRQLVTHNQNFLHFTYDVTGVKWIRLVADSNKTNAQDYAVWADAKLTTTQDAGETVRSLSAYDAQIKAKLAKANLGDKQANLFADKDLELLVLQREFVSRVGQYALKRFMSESEDNRVMLDDWLLNDLDSLREFVLGGAPHKGNYYNSLTVLSEIYKYNKKDLAIAKKLNNKFMPDRTFGELCRTIMFSVALTHDGPIASYLSPSLKVNQSEPLRRYAIFKYLYETERFVATTNSNGTWKDETMTLFGSLRVEEMRFIMSNIIDDESILWLNDYVQTRINANKGVGSYYTPHPYVAYTDPNYNNPVFYADANYDYFNKLFAVDYKGDNGVENNANKYEEGTVGTGKVGLWDTSYTVPAGDGHEPFVMKVSRSGESGTKIQKVWMNFRNKFGTGSVCGGISKSGTNIRTSRGIPAHVIGQPGHAAILYYSQDANGNGSWKIDNDVGGWVAATKNERHLLGWGNETWHRNAGGGGTVVFFHLAQECLNDYDNFVKAEEYTYLAKTYAGDVVSQEKIYEKALTAQVKNLDAWYGLVQTYKANASKTAGEYGAIAARIGETLWNHPMAMNCLLKLFSIETGIQEVDETLKSPVLTTQLKTIEINALAKAKAQGSSAAKSKVNLLLGATDTQVADFSFDGENAGCIVWAESYKESTFRWRYSLDGKKTWSKEVLYEAGSSLAYQLTEDELSSISEDKDIYVYLVGASPDNAFKIDVSSKPALPDTLYANDWENRVIGVDTTYEWRYLTLTKDDQYKAISNWIPYSQASPDCSGDKIIEVRLKGTSKNPPSDGRVFTFTPDTDTAERKYISVSYLSMHRYSTQSQDSGRPNYAVNAIDGNGKTYWHTDYNINVKLSIQVDPKTKKETEIPRVDPYLIIKLDVPRWLSGLEFVQYQYKEYSIFAKTAKVWVSETGEDGSWKLAATREGFENLDDLKVVHFNDSVYGQYVKLEFTERYETNTLDGIFTTVSMVNLYEDTTKTTAPNGEAMKSLSEITPSGTAFAGLGEIIDEKGALDLGGEVIEEFGGAGSPGKSNTGAVVAVVVIVVVLLIGAAATVFVLYKRGIIKIGPNGNTDKGSKPKASSAKSKKTTTESKASTATPKASTPAPAPKASAATPKASTPAPAPKASAATPKASTPAPAPKASITAKVIDATPKASATKPTVINAKPTASTTAPKATTTKPTTSTTAPKASATKPVSTVKPTTKPVTKPTTSTTKPKK